MNVTIYCCLILLLMNKAMGLPPSPAKNSMCSIPISKRVGDNFLLAEFQLNDRYVRPLQSATVAKNTAPPLVPPPFQNLIRVPDLTLSNASYWCQDHAGLCINPQVRGQGWPAGTISGINAGSMF